MCELLIRVKDKATDADPAKDALISKRGHVIVVCPDNWPWSEAERTNPEWIIVKVPGISPNVYSMMMESGLDAVDVNKKLVTRRAFKLNLDNAPALRNITGNERVADITVSQNIIDNIKTAVDVPQSIEIIG